jgi:glycogen(starch) synthase
LLRIAYISYELPPDIPKGGIGTYTINAAAAMKHAGMDVTIFAASHTRAGAEETNGIKIIRVRCENPESFTAGVLPAFEAEHLTNNFDIIECPEIHGNGALIKQQYPQLPLVVRLHAPNYIVESLKKTYTKFHVKARFNIGSIRRGHLKKKWGTYHKETDPDYQFTQLADRISVPSAAMKSLAVKDWKTDAEKITVIANPFYAPAELATLAINDRPVQRILFFGRLNVVKGLVNFTKAAGILLRKYPTLRFDVIGDDGAGPYAYKSMREWMKAQLKNQQQKITFHDGMPQQVLYEHIAQADIVVVPSLFETFSYTCAEAMAAGKAIAGSNAGGMNELLSGKAGLLFDPMNADAIANAVEELITNDALRKEVAANAKKKMTGTEYTENVSTQMLSLYQSLIKKTTAH